MDGDKLENAKLKTRLLPLVHGELDPQPAPLVAANVTHVTDRSPGKFFRVFLGEGVTPDLHGRSQTYCGTIRTCWRARALYDEQAAALGVGG